jgi:acetolactate synthase-1/2/3 large subunit
MKRVSEQIADWLVRQGVEQVFSVTGGGSMFLNQALGVHEGLRCTFMHHEQACAMAAEGYARISGKPAVVMVTTGPGSINALNGVYGAFTDSIPMIVLSGQVKRETCLSFYDLPNLRQLGDQEGPTITMATSVCKHAEIIRHTHDLVRALPESFAKAVSGRPGPVWLDIPLDIQSSVDKLEIPDPVWNAAPLNQALMDQCEEIVERLKKSNRPLILGGTGVRLAGATERLVMLIEKTGIPLATAWTHDLIASDHPLFAGRPGTIGSRAGNFCVQNADFVLVLGSRLNIRQTSYNWNSFARNAWVAQVDVDPAELKKPTYSASQTVVADIGQFLDAFEPLLEKDFQVNFSAWAEWCRNIGARYAPCLEHQQFPDAPLNPYLVVDRIFRQLREDDIIACGNASACILPFQVGNLKASQRMFSNSGAASMGYELPAAIGAAIATANTGKRRVICFAGDGSLQLNIQELQTLKTSGLNVIIVVLNNRGYLSIKQTHENFFGRVIGATPESGVEFPDFALVARAYGIRSTTIYSQGDLIALDSMISENGPILIDVRVDPNQEFVPRIKSRVDVGGSFVTPELDDMYPFLPAETISSIKESALSVTSFTSNGVNV